jgi:hypothetical protein
VRLAAYPPLLPDNSVFSATLIVSGDQSHGTQEVATVPVITPWCWAFKQVATPGDPTSTDTTRIFCRETDPTLREDNALRTPVNPLIPRVPADTNRTDLLTDERDDAHTFADFDCGSLFSWYDFVNAGTTPADKTGTIKLTADTPTCATVAGGALCAPLTDPAPLRRYQCSKSKECFTSIGLPLLFFDDSPETSNDHVKFKCCVHRNTTSRWDVPDTNITEIGRDQDGVPDPGSPLQAHIAFCVSVTEDGDARSKQIQSVCVAYALLSAGGAVLHQRGYRCNHTCAYPYATDPSVGEGLCDPREPEVNCHASARSTRCIVDMNVAPGIFCPEGGRPYRYSKLFIDIGQGQDPGGESLISLGEGYTTGTGGVSSRRRNDAFIQVVRASCATGRFDCDPGFDCRCYGDVSDSVRDCTSHSLCNLHGTLWESRNPLTRPVCQCNNGYIGPTCGFQVDTVEKCSLSSQESTLSGDVFSMRNQ